MDIFSCQKKQGSRSNTLRYSTFYFEEEESTYAQKTTQEKIKKCLGLKSRCVL